MVIDTAERDLVIEIIVDLENQAVGHPEHSATRTGMFRLAAALRLLLKKSVVVKLGRNKA